MNVFTYVTTNKISYCEQAVFSCLSLLKSQRSYAYKIVIFTDQIDFFKNCFDGATVDIEYVHLPKTLQDRWLEPARNVFRIKLKIFEEIWSRYPDARVVFFDSDTYITGDFEKWFRHLSKSRQTLMNTDEGNISEGRAYGLRRIYKKLQTLDILVDGQPFRIPPDLHMFNSGVIGVGPHDKDLIGSALKFHDDFFNSSKFFYTEQIALSYVLSRNSNLLDCDSDLTHYWYVKEFGEKVSQFIQDIKDRRFHEKLRVELPISKVPTRHQMREDFWFKLNVKIKKRLFQMGLRDAYLEF
jgi:hypothetical protein